MLTPQQLDALHAAAAQRTPRGGAACASPGAGVAPGAGAAADLADGLSRRTAHIVTTGWLRNFLIRHGLAETVANKVSAAYYYHFECYY